MRHFFIFGREPALSRAELISKFKIEKIKSAIIDEGVDFAIANIAGDFNAREFISQLGGMVKIGIIEKEDVKLNEKLMLDLIKPQTKKLNFGISAYGFNPNINELGGKIKKMLASAKQKSRFVASKKYPLSSVIVQKELLKNGIEFTLLKTKDKLFIGKTTAVQPFEEFSALDYGRPARDPRSGMLPPKLATIMLNLSEAKKDETILDPFCGSGTILQQALLLNYENIIGADISDSAIRGTKTNITWIETQIQKKLYYNLFQSDIKDLCARIGESSIDAIITEPYLGPGLRGDENDEKLNELVSTLETLYKNTFQAMSNLLKPNGKIIIVIPEWHINEKIYHLDVDSLIADKLKIIDCWQYRRPNQFIARQIFKILKM